MQANENPNLKRIIYSAKDIENKEKFGFIKAVSNKEALGQLQQQGLRDIQFHDDTIIGFGRDDLQGLSDKELSQIAKFELKIRTKEFSVLDLVVQTIRQSMVFILIGLAILAYGYYQQKVWAIVLGGIWAFSLPIITIFRSKYARHFHHLLVAYAFGDEKKAMNAIDALRVLKNQPDIQSELDFKQAFFIVKNQGIEKALELVKQWQSSMDTSSPGLFHSRVASLYLAQDDAESFLELMNQAYEVSEENELIAVDLALAEAHYGSQERAEQLLSKINQQTVLQQAQPYMIWIKAIIAAKKKESGAVSLYEQSINGFKHMKENPVAWPVIAVVKAELAVLIHAHGERQKAIDLLEDVWNILIVHGDKWLIEDCQKILKS